MVYSTSGYTVRAGTSTRNSGGTVYSVFNVISHSSYNSRTTDYDVAVIRISGSFTLGSNVKAVGLAISAPASGASAVVTGWGTTTEGGSAANTLQYVTVPIVANSACNSYYGSGSITARMVCAGYTSGGRDACQGDSGGPLVSGGVQVGIVSWGYGCARPNYPGVYTNVAHFRSWISSNTGV
ncbi:hypothetical protein R5R35_010570 [Gryllus longicercus]|uniref:Peptidase S1 domain-containing protein n=1 Tax=Gryllus longicercus TaxID=2509291 RepID=A0AAN9VQV0_9ORTH